jgi:hypothetical protein
MVKWSWISKAGCIWEPEKHIRGTIDLFMLKDFKDALAQQAKINFPFSTFASIVTIGLCVETSPRECFILVMLHFLCWGCYPQYIHRSTLPLDSCLWKYDTATNFVKLTLGSWMLASRVASFLMYCSFNARYQHKLHHSIRWLDPEVWTCLFTLIWSRAGPSCYNRGSRRGRRWCWRHGGRRR